MERLSYIPQGNRKLILVFLIIIVLALILDNSRKLHTTSGNDEVIFREAILSKDINLCKLLNEKLEEPNIDINYTEEEMEEYTSINQKKCERIILTMNLTRDLSYCKNISSLRARQIFCEAITLNNPDLCSSSELNTKNRIDCMAMIAGGNPDACFALNDSRLVGFCRDNFFLTNAYRNNNFLYCFGLSDEEQTELCLDVLGVSFSGELDKNSIYKLAIATSNPNFCELLPNKQEDYTSITSSKCRLQLSFFESLKNRDCSYFEKSFDFSYNDEFISSYAEDYKKEISSYEYNYKNFFEGDYEQAMRFLEKQMFILCKANEAGNAELCLSLVDDVSIFAVCDALAKNKHSINPNYYLNSYYPSSQAIPSYLDQEITSNYYFLLNYIANSELERSLSQKFVLFLVNNTSMDYNMLQNTALTLRNNSFCDMIGRKSYTRNSTNYMMISSETCNNVLLFLMAAINKDPLFCNNISFESTNTLCRFLFDPLLDCNKILDDPLGKRGKDFNKITYEDLILCNAWKHDNVSMCTQFDDEYMREEHCKGNYYYFKAASEDNLTYCDNIKTEVDKGKKEYCKSLVLGFPIFLFGTR